MELPPDMSLWTWVKQKIAPLCSPVPYRVSAPTREMMFVSTLDLHGMTVQEAYEASQAHLSAARAANAKSCCFITGKSGQIRREFPTWMEINPLVLRTAPTNAGAFIVQMKSVPTKIR